MDLGSVLFGAGRAEEGGPAPARIPQAASHGLGPASRLGAGLAAQGVEPGTDRGTVEGPVRRRPVDADQPRVPLPVDLRQAAAGAGPAPVSGARQETPDEEKGQEGERAAHPDARAHRGPARGGRIQEGVRPFRVGHGGRCRAVEALHEHAGGAQEPQAVRPARRRQERVRHGQGRIRDLQGHTAGRARRPHVGQRHGGEPAHAGGRGAGHAHVLRRPVQFLAAWQQREQERQDPPLPAQGNQFRGSHAGRARRDRRGDQRHPDEAPRLQNAQRGMGRGDRQATIEGSQPEHKRCAYKLNPGMSSPIEKGRMMVRALTLEDLNKAAKLGGPSTLSEKTLLEPAAGPEGIIAPAKYTGSNGATYVFEDRYIGGESKRTVLVDSRTSQSNRLEDYVTKAIKDGHPVLSRMPRIRVTYQVPDETGETFERSYLETQLPHRAFDGHIRIGSINGKSTSELTEYVQARNSTAENMMPLFTLSPITVAFGGWDSTRRKNQLRIASPFNGEIIGVLANQDQDRPVFRAGARVDPVEASIKFDKDDAKAIGRIIQPEVSDNTFKTFEKEGKGSKIGLGAIPPSTKNDAYDGIAVSNIIRTHVLSFSTLRSLRFGKGPEGDAAIRVLIAALILDAMAGSNSELVLRANCVLRESAKPTMILDKRFGESDELDMLDLSHADELLTEAYDQAVAKAGVDWHGQVLEVTGNPLVMKAGSADESED